MSFNETSSVASTSTLSSCSSIGTTTGAGLTERADNRGCCKYAEKQDVLARWSDGLFYLGSILKVDEKRGKCYIQFEDKSEYWALFKDIQKGPEKGEITCSLCTGGISERPNEIVLCDNCGLGYHQLCHNPVIESDILRPDVQWFCRQCVFATTAKKGGAMKKGPNARALQMMKQSLPYNLSSLTWDAHHKTNTQQCYCYCGGPGDWYLKMLQCCRCRQWFHEACIQCLDRPLLNGDRFYIFVCSFCNSGPEYIKRLELKWVDVAHLALFNLTIQHIKKYYDFDEVILPWIHQNWDKLQLKQLENVCRPEREKYLLPELKDTKSRFICGKEIKKKLTLWGLRVRLPPQAPTIILPLDGQITDEIMNNLQMKGRRTKTFVPVQSQTPVPIRYKRKREGEDLLERRSSKARKLFVDHNGKNEDVSSDSQSCCGFGRHSSPCSISGDSSSDSGDLETASQGTLDSIIPWPNSYEGLNHPFKTDLERNIEIQHTKIRKQILNSYQNGLGFSDENDNSIPASPVLSSAIENIKYSPSAAKRVRSKPGRKSKADLAILAAAEEYEKLMRRQTKDTKAKYSTITRNNNNVLDPMALDGLSNHKVSIKHLQSSVKQYFGAADRLAKGQKFKVLSRRVTPDGKVQYLVEWEGITA